MTRQYINDNPNYENLIVKIIKNNKIFYCREISLKTNELLSQFLNNFG